MSENAFFEYQLHKTNQLLVKWFEPNRKSKLSEKTLSQIKIDWNSASVQSLRFTGNGC